MVYSGVFAAASALVNVVDTCSICDVCVVLDMHGLLAMRRQYMRIVEEVGRVIEAGTE